MIRRYGELATDPELFYSSQGLAVCRLTIRGKTGNFVSAVAFGKVAEELTEGANKGDELSLIGYFRERKWTTVDGEDRVAEEFVVKHWEERK